MEGSAVVATVVLNYPIRMVSLSAAALEKAEGILHEVKQVISVSHAPNWLDPEDPKFDKWYRQHLGGWQVRTACGQTIDAAPETHQRVRPCSRCLRRNEGSYEPASLVRLLPPVHQSEEDRSWTRYYWGHVGYGLNLGPVREGGDSAPPERTGQRTTPA